MPATAHSPLAHIPPILRPADAGSLAKVGKAGLYAAIKTGALPSFKRGRSRFIAGPAFQQWLGEGMPLTAVDAEAQCHG